MKDSSGYPEREEALDISMFNSLYKIYIEGCVKLDEIPEENEKARFDVVRPFYDFLMRMSNGQKFKLICTLFDRLFEVEQESRFLSMDVASMLRGSMKINEDVTPGTDDVQADADNNDEGVSA